MPAALSVTWDYLDRLHGPFHDAVMWLDIEGSELEALYGANGLFTRKAILLVNVEMASRLEHKNARIMQFMDIHGFKVARDWNVNEAYLDRIFVLRS